MSAESGQNMPNLTDVAAGITNLESQLTRSAASAPSENAPNAKGREFPSANVPDAKRRKKVFSRRKANGPAAPAAAEAPTTSQACLCCAAAAAEAAANQRSMDEARRFLAEHVDDGSFWSKAKCQEIIKAVEAIPENAVTSKERWTYLKALDEYDYPDWVRELKAQGEAAASAHGDGA